MVLYSIFSLTFSENYNTFESHHHNKATMKTTRYFEEQVLRKRPIFGVSGVKEKYYEILLLS
jgi:hypothetical protein